MSRFDKLLEAVLKLSRNLRFEDLAKVLKRMGYTQSQPKSGSSHYIFRKTGCSPISLPKSTDMDIVYIRLVREAVIKYLSE